jgi:signal recognition particle subunit SRP54
MMGMGGGAMPSPDQMAELAKKAKAGGMNPNMDMPNAPPTLPPNFPGAPGLPNLPGLGGGKLPGLPGGFHGLGKKK